MTKSDEVPSSSSESIEPNGETNVAGTDLPSFAKSGSYPETADMTTILHPDGRMSQYPPQEKWDDWVEWDGKAWPKRVARRFTLVPTVCFNCESGCGLLAYVDKETFEIRKFEGNPAHPGSRGRNCAKGPATLNQTYDPERILYPLKRVGERGEGNWERISWEQALEEISSKMRKSRIQRRDGIIYHVGRPGEDGYATRVIEAWGVDGHNSHTNICSAGARTGYSLWGGFDRPSPDHTNARVILLLSSHLEAGHYFNPHAQRIVEGKMKGAKIITMDPRLSNTASKSDVWLPTWPGSESAVLLCWANHLIQNDLYDTEFMRRWSNWREFLSAIREGKLDAGAKVRELVSGSQSIEFDTYDRVLKALYAEFSFERAAEEAKVSERSLREAAEYIAHCDGRLAAHTWRAASIGNLGGWQVARCLFFLNMLTGSVGARGGTAANSWNKFVPKPFANPPSIKAWNEMHYPDEWPLSHYEMSFLLPHLLEEGRGTVDVYFTRVYNPLWTNPDGFMWLKALRDEQKIKCHVALTPTWNETTQFADYVLPMGLAGERHDLMSQETHASQWIAFRQPVRRVAIERAGKKMRFTYEANPGEVWEENEFWIELSTQMDPDGSLGIRQWFESPYRLGETITVEEYYRWIFENSVPGLPEIASEEGFSPLAYMRKYGAFEIKRDNYQPFENRPSGLEEGAGLPSDFEADEQDRIHDPEGAVVGVMIDGEARLGVNTPSRKFEFYSSTLAQWGWPELEYALPWPLQSHVAHSEIDRDKGEMLLLPTFRLPTLIHTRSANSKWLYEISHKNPVWMHPEDAERLNLKTNDLARIETEIGYFVDKTWVTEGIKPGIVAVSHHLGRWRLSEDQGVNRGMSNLARLEQGDDEDFGLKVIHGAEPWESFDPDTSRIWWKEVGVHQNLTHAVHPDPISGGHCWLQKATLVVKAGPGDRNGDIWVDTERSMDVYRQWLSMTRAAADFSPDGNRRPRWISRPLKPTQAAYKLP
ncbi:MAG: molybdopterin-dependent oxidoreductase [Anaerolineales bacterium]